MSPPSLAVEEALCAAILDLSQHGASAWLRWQEQRNRLKGRLAALIGTEAERLALLPGTSRAIIDLSLSIDWKKSDRIVLFTGEFPANVTPWQQAAHSFELETVFLPLSDFEQEPALSRLEAELQKGVRLVAVSLVQFQTGLRMPVEAMGRLCHRYGAELAVDGIQAVGAVPFGLESIDYLAAGAHKWLMGPEGCGFLYVAPGKILKPRVASWLSHQDAARFLFEPGALRYDRPLVEGHARLEVGITNTFGFAGLEASVALLQNLGVEQIFSHIQGILDVLEEGLVERGFTSLRAPYVEGRSCILSVLPPVGQTAVELASGLAKQGVMVNTPDGCLRIAPHWPNGLEQVPEFFKALDKVLNGG
jgi:selenocysteine lyase/cysteine desulfurase